MKITKFSVAVCFSFFLLLFFLLFSKLDFYKNLELGIIDFFFTQRESRLVKYALAEDNPYISDKAKVVGIDSISLEKIGKWPWYRDVHAGYLNNIQQFNPSAVLLDIFFILDEKMPSSLEKIISERREISNTIRNAFDSSDRKLASEFNKHNNVFIDIFLLPKAKGIYDTSIIQNTKATEKLIIDKKNVNFPFTNFGNENLEFYESLEPLIKRYIKSANVGPVNMKEDIDNTLRHALLLHPYLREDKKKNYLLSNLLQMVMRYYNVSIEDISVSKKGIYLNNATVADLDDYGNTIEKLISIPELKKNIIEDKRYKIQNKNTYNFVLNEYSHLYDHDDSEKTPSLPIKLLQMEDGKYKFIKGYDIYKAVLKIKAKSIKVILCKKQDIFIPTRLLTEKDNTYGHYNMPINYPGRDSIENNKRNYRIPTKSYYEVYLNPKLPDIPQNFNYLNPTEKKKIYQWFYDYTFYKVNNIKYTAYRKSKNISISFVASNVLEENIFDARYYFFYLYLKQNNIKDGDDVRFSKTSYLNFLKNLKQKYKLSIDDFFFEDENFLLSHKSIIRIFMEAYQEGYSEFYDNHIFTGAIARGMAKDIYQTSYGDNFGINILASSFNTIVTQQFLRPLNSFVKFVILLFCCFLFSFIYIYVSNKIKYFIFAISSILILSVSFVLFVDHNIILNTINIFLCNFFAFGVILIYNLITEERDKNFLKATFSSYLSPDVIDEIYHSKQSPKLGGEEKKVTAYFTDIKGFSSFSEILTPTELVLLLNEYLTEMTDVLFEKKGTLDKYEGDAIIAFFGAPIDISNSPYVACLSALKMNEKLAILRSKWSKEKKDSNVTHVRPKLYTHPDDKWPTLVHNMEMRIGLNYSNMLIGNMGSQARMNYTMMGDGVNLAARLEALGKQYGVSIVASESIFGARWKDEEEDFYHSVEDYILFRILDKVIVVGKTEPVKIYEVVAIKEEATKNQIEKCNLFEKGLNHYFDMQWDDAIKYFTKTKKLEVTLDKKGLNPSIVLLERCKAFKAELPVSKKGEKWNGVFRATSK